MASSRRAFLKSSAAAALASATGRGICFPADKPARAAPPALLQFGYGDVELLQGPLRDQFDTNHAFYAALDEDRLLKPFRQRAGLPASGEDMGGWYSWAPLDALDRPGDNGFAPCHSFGQYLSAMARFYAVTGRESTRNKVHRIVREFAPAITEEFWRDHRFPAYTYDKIAIGLLDAHTLAGAPDALKVLDRALDSVKNHLPPGGISRAQQYARPHRDDSFCWDEPYTVPENAFLAWQSGAGQRYRDLAVRFLPDPWYFDPLARGENVLPGKHAYSHVNCLSSAMQAYFVLGDEKYLRAARNGFDFVRAQSFATGGWGPDEQFRAPASGEVGESLGKTHSSFETPCGSYAHFKIARYLLRATRDSRYGDSIERVLYNCILGARSIKPDGHGFYYSDYNNDGAKFYHPYKWHCCTGTFAQITADYAINAYLRDESGVYVNLFVPSRVHWKRAGGMVTLTQRTGYPHQPEASIEIALHAPARFAVHLRVPQWSGQKTRIAVNGKHVVQGPEAGRFAMLDRTWTNGDRIEVEFDMPVTLQPVDAQHPNVVAPVRGPLVLFSEGAVPAGMRKQDVMGMTQAARGSAEWQVNTATGTLTLRPFTAIQDEHYRLYLPLEG